ncbi:MAG: putative ABC exporter domain-containing protein [Planctomycetota bacterium]
MNKGLVYLLRKGPRAAWRQVRRRFRGVKGILLLIATLLILALMIVPQFLSQAQLRQHGAPPDVDDALRRYASPAMLLLILITTSKGTLYFKPAEIQFLFPAPVSRRQLLLFHVLTRLRVHVLSAIWMSIFLAPRAHCFYAVPVAVFLFLAFLQLTTQAGGLLLAALDERVAKQVRRLYLPAVLGLVAVLLVAMRAQLREADLATVARALADSPMVQALAWITRPFLEAFLARSVADLALWSCVSLAILVVIFGALMLVDVAYTEDALAQAKRVQQALKRMRTGGAFTATGPGKSRLRVPALPRWHGAGPLAWRQLQEIARNLGGVLRIGLIMAIWIAAPLIGRGAQGAHSPEGFEFIWVPLGLVVVMTPLLSANITFDFRRDLDRMAFLKSLPLSAAAIAAGQILPMVVLFSLWEVVGVTAIACISGTVPAQLALALVLLIPALNWVVMALDNLIFLLLPYRPPTRDPGRLPFMGRIMVVMFVKMISLFLLGGLALLAGYLTWHFLSPSFLLCGTMAALLFTSASWPLTCAVGAAFRSFDVSKDVPD